MQASTRFQMHMQQTVTRQLMGKEYASLRLYHSGQLVNRVFSDVSVVQGGILNLFPSLLRILISLVGAAVILIRMDWRFVPVMIVAGLVSAVLTVLFRNPMKRRHKRMQEAEDRLHAATQETLENVRLIKASAGEDYALEEMDSQRELLRNEQLRNGRLSILMNQGMGGMFGYLKFLICVVPSLTKFLICVVLGLTNFLICANFPIGKFLICVTGLFITHAFDENGSIPQEIYRKLLLDKLEVDMGMVMENIVAQMLVSRGHKLYFYSNPDRENKENRMEIDFLIAKSAITNRHNISPIEVKSSKNYTLKSIQKFMTKYSEQLHIPYVLHPGDLMEKDGITYLPLYMTSFL